MKKSRAVRALIKGLRDGHWSTLVRHTVVVRANRALASAALRGEQVAAHGQIKGRVPGTISAALALSIPPPFWGGRFGVLQLVQLAPFSVVRVIKHAIRSPNKPLCTSRAMADDDDRALDPFHRHFLVYHARRGKAMVFVGAALGTLHWRDEPVSPSRCYPNLTPLSPRRHAVRACVDGTAVRWLELQHCENWGNKRLCDLQHTKLI